ncbi:MAG TPA: glycosyltransferase family 4 protein [Candidatus Bipolaricaulota bacterium]|nr:glycosyltransferase family 4 protein [Candidatus Bipolaricaulota bacterium]
MSAKDKSNLKIAQVVCVVPPYGGGIGVVAHCYASELSRLGHQVDVFVPRFDVDPDYKRNYNLRLLRPLIRSGNASLVPNLYWRLKNKYDIVHLHYPFIGGTEVINSLRKKRFIKKLVVSYHMDFVGEGVKGKLLKYYASWQTPRIIKTADKVVVSSIDYMMDSSIRKFYLKDKAKFLELPFGVKRTYRVRPKDPYLLKRFKIKPEDKILLFVGGLDAAHYFKGVNYLIDAMKYLDANYKLIVVGEGDLKKTYIEQAKSIGQENRIFFTGYIESDQLPDYYALCDLFVLPSVDKSEAFGIVLVEALASGKPVIASNLKGVRTVVDSGRNGLLFEPKNSKDISDKAKIILQNTRLYAQFSENATKVANMKYRWPQIVKKLEEAYLEIL